jgi:1,4-alpha-glucan branching enzyme
MPGDYWRKFANARLFSAYQMTFPGKKLSFMGNEIGQFREWDADGEIEWFLLDFDAHAKYQYYVSELNDLYLRSPELWQMDASPGGFTWLDPNDSSRSIISFMRRGRCGRELIVVMNFTPTAYEDYTLRVSSGGRYEEVFNSDGTEFGGSGVTNKGAIFESAARFCNGEDLHTIRMRLPPLGVSVLKRKTNH